jgi:hypothetical protein
VTPSATLTSLGVAPQTNLIGGSTWRFVLFGPTLPIIPSGNPLLTAQFLIAAGAPSGTLSVNIFNTQYFDNTGVQIASGTSTGGTITVTGGGTGAPTITQQPQNQTVQVGQTAAFSVTAAGTGPLAYQWYYALPGSSSFIALSGATSSSYTTPPVTGSYNGYKYYATVSNSAGTTPSSVATLTVSGGGQLPTPDLSGLPLYVPVNGSLTAGFPSGYTNLTFTWTITPATGTPPSYGGAPGLVISRASAASFQTPSNVASLSSYSLVPGYYTVTVYASGNGYTSSGVASKNISLVLADLSAVRVYPNPWRSDKHTGRPITFDQMTVGATVKIFTVSGHQVKKLDGSSGSVTWDLTNDSGDKVASGLYIYLVTVGDTGAYGTGGQKATGKLAIIK